MKDLLDFLRSIEGEIFFAAFVGGFFLGCAFILVFCRLVDRREHKRRRIKHPFLFE